MANRHIQMTLSKPQKVKLSKGKTIRLSGGALKNGNDDVLVSNSQFKKIQKRIAEGRGMDIQLNQEQIEGSGFFSSIGDAFRKVGNYIKQGGEFVGTKVLLPVVEKLGQEFAKDPIGTIEKGIKLASVVGAGAKKQRGRPAGGKIKIIKNPRMGKGFFPPGFKVGKGVIPPGGGAIFRNAKQQKGFKY